jgi:hypothetical protein
MDLENISCVVGKEGILLGKISSRLRLEGLVTDSAVGRSRSWYLNVLKLTSAFNSFLKPHTATLP